MDFPASPAIGQQFSNGVTTWQWDGTGWNIVPQVGPAFISDTPPPNPAIGQQWWRSSNGQLYIWYDDGNSKQWVQAAGVPGSVSPWEKIADYVIPDAGVSEVIFKDLAPFDLLRCNSTLHPVTTATGIFVIMSDDNGATFINGASDYYAQTDYGQGTLAGAGVANQANIALSGGSNIITGPYGVGVTSELKLYRFNKAGYTRGRLDSDYQAVSTGVLTTLNGTIGCSGRTTPKNALRYYSSQLFSGHILIEGVRG